MKCLCCDSDMVFDDVDHCGRVKIEKYFNCPNCQTSVIVSYINHVPTTETWHTENYGVARDFKRKARRNN